MCRRQRICLIAALLALCSGGASAAGAVLTFEGLQNFEQVANYYNGGNGSLGTGPGPAYGVTFSAFGLAYIPGQQSGMVTPFPGDPSPPTVLLLDNLNGPAGFPTSMTMDSVSGFAQDLSFYEIYIGTNGSVQIYSGPDGTGTLLAQQALPMTGTLLSNAVFTGPIDVPFSGTAHSAVFTGGNNQLALDNIALLGPVPEPSSWVLLMLGVGGACWIFKGTTRRRGGAPGPARPNEAVYC